MPKPRSRRKKPKTQSVANTPTSPELPWQQQVNYQKLLANKQVRDLISQHSSKAVKQLSGESILFLSEKLLPIDLSCEFVVPLSKKLGIKTGKTKIQSFDLQPGQIIIASLCSLALRGLPPGEVQQHQQGLQLQATIPSNLFSWEGMLYVSIQQEESGTQVEAATKIGGQLYDWGRSKRILNTLFEDIQQISESLAAESGPG